MTRYFRSTLLVLATTLTILSGTDHLVADQPKLGIYGEMVTVPREFQFGGGLGKGYRIDRVCWGSHAAGMGLERGDIIVVIDNMWFQDREGFRAALRQTGTTARIGLINVRTGRMTWRRCRLNHRPHYGEPIPGTLGFLN